MCVCYICIQLLKEDHVYFTEDSTIDLDKREYVMVTHNESYQHMINIEETASYTVHPTNEQWTRFVHEGKINCSKWGAIGEQFEKFSSRLYKQEAIQVREDIFTMLQIGCFVR